MTTRPRSEARRLDAVVAAVSGLTRTQARALILAGKVHVDDAPATKPGGTVPAGARVVVAERPRFVSRGGEKLAGGASTGGFTDALLQAGARSVTALDVGYGQLAWALREDPRVRVVERTNFRLLGDDAFPNGFDLVVVDASFISLRTIAARAVSYLRDGGAIIALVKPQFEAGRERLRGSGGVVRDAAVHAAVLHEVRAALAAQGLHVVDAALSTLRGPSGNVEFFFLLRREGPGIAASALDALVERAHVAPKDGGA